MSQARGSPTLNVARLLHGREGPDPLDPAEEFHEASKLYRSTLAREMMGTWLFAANHEVLVTQARAVKRYPHLPLVPLPAPELPEVPLGGVLQTRRSCRAFSPLAALSGRDLAALLFAGYGLTLTRPVGHGFSFRTAPSGGALYPLEFYLAVGRSGGVSPGLYHYDPSRHGLEVLGAPDVFDRLAGCLVQPDVASGAAAILVVTALFWRSRLKYGLRGYRFALLEAGHAAQNVLLMAEALHLGAVPIGGFFDSEVELLLEIDGVNESVLYVIALGRPAPAADRDG
ncbi:MAG: SagB/ThcOx family dehydrogenase [Armatimonadota bacterium]|nr:SagB/ThcOx family dehydrogenase [Armatimonadota bacterium]MDR7428474.1 SagB/ThcOx family dehydrogenase [Armatimonadota bacterium]MDR7464939.1 SagB/ThcOx family dehydrogenase [Armatimonadota bacterium]MDR7469660.1 SagB/ThcOx family dehydrogenase [Armatimonadota bacterium]MDR7474909.1 SagB/ThcOx family dehydrogenase [Armatimonadota bacterium]